MEQFLRPSQVKVSRWLFGGLLILTVALLLITIWEVTSTTSMGENDFVGYWSATYLFRNGQNPYDPSLMELIQNTKLKTSQDATIMAWNPPTLFVFLLPLAWLSFPQAKFVWLSINLIFVIVSSLMLANTFNAPKNTRLFPVLLVFALVFPPVVSGFYMGQVTFLVLLGLIAAVWLIKKDWWFGAGMALILTTIKPHLMILSMTYLLIFMVQKRKYKGLAGLFFSGLVCITILFLFRPYWIDDVIGLSRIAPTNWATPTIGGLLSSLGITELARYLIVLFIPLPVFLAWNHAKFSMEFSIAILTLVTIPVTFFGWNYDQSMLLIPISLIFTWLAKSKKSIFKLLIIASIITALGVNLYLRFVPTNDLLFVWFPLFWWLIFLLVWRNHSLQARLT